MPVIAKPYWWQFFLHTAHASKLSRALLRYGGDRVVVINVPFHTEPAGLQEGLIEEEQLQRQPVTLASVS